MEAAIGWKELYWNKTECKQAVGSLSPAYSLGGQFELQAEADRSTRELSKPYLHGTNIPAPLCDL